MKKNPRKTRWTKAFRHNVGKELTMDTTFEFEKKRNVPVKYDRELVTTTVKAMKKISEVKEQRQKQFYENRMKAKKKSEKLEALKDLEKNIDVIQSPSAIQRQQEEEPQKIKIKAKKKAIKTDKMEME